MLDSSEAKRMLLIINPVSGKKLAQRSLPEVIKLFSDGGYFVTVMATSRRGDATAFAAQYGGDFDLIVCVGGDGTLNEVVTGMVEKRVDTPLGYIPAGSTNDFAACHKLSSDMITAAQNILVGSPAQFDVGRFGDAYFNYVAAFGAFSWLSYTTPQNLKNVFGHSAYIMDAVKDLPRVKSEWLSFNAGGKTYQGNFIFGAICSSTSVAGVFELPENIVDTCDGMFEVLLIHEPPTIIDYQNIIRSMLEKDYDSNPYIEFFQVSRLTVDSRKKHTDWSLDGEHAVAAQNMAVEILRGVVTLIS